MTNSYSKPAAMFILFLVLLCTWVLLAEPYLDLWQDRIAQAERQQRKHNALSLLIGDREIYEQQFQAISDSRGLHEIFVDNKNGALADAKLQRIVKELVSNSGGKVLQVMIAKTWIREKNQAETNDEKTITVNVMMQGSIESIYTMLQSLENSRPLILVSNLEITHIKSRHPVSQAISDASYRAKYNATAFIL
jgi:hypothetical protein